MRFGRKAIFWSGNHVRDVILSEAKNLLDALELRGRKLSLRGLLLAAPLIFVAHFLEESPGFVAWFNAHVARGTTEQMFWTVNYTGLAITLVVVALAWLDGSALSDIAVVAWFSFLFAANALLHLTATVVDRAPMPGVVTAVALYVPFYAWVMRLVAQSRRLPRRVMVGAAVVGGIPMLAHGYLIIFRGSRLF